MENKTSKYFKYAIGEIILVVIGILIALQLNTFKENQRLKQQEITYYCKIIEDLRADITNIDIVKASLNSRQIAAKRLLTNLLKIQDKKDTLLTDYLSALRSLDFIPTKAAIEDITSSGKLENLKNQKLKNEILNFYVQQDYATKVVSQNDKEMDQKIFSYNYYTDFGIHEVPLYKDIFGDELKGLLKSKEWQKDPNNLIFVHLKDQMNMSVIICEREKDLLGTIKNSANGLIDLLEPYCKSND